jgi:hypothetical protein
LAQETFLAKLKGKNCKDYQDHTLPRMLPHKAIYQDHTLPIMLPRKAIFLTIEARKERREEKWRRMFYCEFKKLPDTITCFDVVDCWKRSVERWILDNL